MTTHALTQERLHQVLHYDAESGIFRWAVKRKKCPAGKVAGSISNYGYKRIGIDGTTHLLHRLVFLYVYGAMPTGCVDHVDGDRSNNSLANLRDVSSQVNMQNIHGSPISSRHGVLGARLQRNGSWSAQIQKDGKWIYLGSFKTSADAHLAYMAAKKALHPEANIVQPFSSPAPQRNDYKIGRSGMRGVTWNSAAGKWETKVIVRGRQIRLGRFDDPDAARAAYLAGIAKYKTAMPAAEP